MMKKILTTILTLAMFFSISPVKALPSEETKIIGFGLSSGEFLAPKGVAIDEDGNIYLLDSGNYRVQVFDNNGNFKFMFGGKGNEPFQFMQPAGIAVKNGKVYITDGYADIPASNKVVVYDTNGKFLFTFGERGGEDGNLTTPTGIAVDEQKYIYVCDIGNKRIEKFTETGRFIKTLGGNIVDSPMGINLKNGKIYVTDWKDNKVFVLSSQGTKIKEFSYEGLDIPTGVATDDNENIYVVDSGLNACIFKFNKDGKFLKQIGRYGVGHGEFFSPYGIAIYKDLVIISDQDGSRVEALTKEGNFLWEIRSPFFRKEAVNLPSDMTVKDNIYIADSLNWRILVLNKQGEFVNEIKEIQGIPQWMTVSKKMFDRIDMPFVKYPVFIKVLKNGNLLIGDYGKSEVIPDEFGKITFFPYFRFLIIDADGNYKSSFGDPNRCPSVDGMDIDEVKNEIYAVFRSEIFVFDFKGNLSRKMNLDDPRFGFIQDIYITEANFIASFYPSGKVAEFTRDGKLLQTISSFGTEPGKTSYPHGLTLDSSGNLYIADSGNARVQIFDKYENLKEYFGARGTRTGEFIHPIKISLTEEEIFVLDDYTGKITVFERETKKLVRTLCETSIKEGKLLFPVAVAATSTKEIIVLDGYLGLIHKFDQDGTPLFKFSTEIDITQRFSSSPLFNYNGKIAIDENDNIYVTAPYNDFVYIFDKFGNMVNGISCAIFGMQTPFGIFIGKDKIYVTDASLSSIFVFDKKFTKLMFSFGNLGTETGELNSPWGVSADTEGNIYIADSGNLEVKIFDSTGNFIKEVPIEVDYREPPFTPTDIFYYEGYLYVLDSYNHKIILMNKKGETVATFGQKGGPAMDFFNFNGIEFYKNDYGKFLYPLGIFVRDKKIYLADTSNFRVQIISLDTFFDITPPEISVNSVPPKFINKNYLDFTFKVNDDKTQEDKIGIYIDINGNGFNKISGGDTLRLKNLSEGPYRIFAKAIDLSGNESNLIKIEFIVDLTSPQINLNFPEITENEKVKLNGSISDSLSGVKELKIKGNSLKIENNGSFSTDLNLNPGLNEILFEATDFADNKTLKSANIYRKVTMVLKVGQNKFTVNGVEEPLDASPIIKNGRTLVPMRVIIEALGGTVIWEDSNKKITILLKDEKIELWVGKNIAVINGVMKLIDYLNPDIVPEIINGRTMLPVRFVATNLGFNMQWDNATKTITINN